MFVALSPRLNPLDSSLIIYNQVRKAADPPGPGKVQGSAQTCISREVTLMVVAKDGNELVPVLENRAFHTPQR